MTDITRPSNPALSFSSYNDDAVVTGYQMRACPERIEIQTPSPRTTITGGSLGILDDGRCKSAPPIPVHTKEELENIEEAATGIMSSTYDPRRHGRLPTNPDGRQTNGQTYFRHPESSMLRTHLAPGAGANPNAANVADLLLSNALIGVADCLSQAHTNDIVDDLSPLLNSKLQENQVEQIDGRQLSRPIPQTASQLSSIPHQGGGTLIFRPNPVKAAEINTTNLSSSELVRAVANATSDQVEAYAENVLVNLYPHQERADEDSDNTAQGKSSLRFTTPSEEKKAEESWCVQAFVEANQESKRKKKQAKEQQKHELQVDFPENNYNTDLVMPSASHGRVSGDVEDYKEVKPTGYQTHHSKNGEGAQKRQAQQQNHRDRMNSLRESSGGGSLGNRNRNNEDMHPEVAASARSIQPTPLFERLVTEEVQELKTYAGIVERQNLELAKQKKVQEDLEARLRGETRRRKELETLLEEQERLWSEKFMELEQQRNTAEKLLHDEQTKTKKLINQVQRKDRDIHDFFKKKYDQDGSRSIRNSVRGGHGGPAERNPSPNTAGAARSADFPQQSPRQLLDGLGSDEKVREGNAKNLLLDFFGI
uniref:Uncharacterized protein n=1 Tax=Amphora coffeiformis TaxID=265554 RepID=A0A7S3KVW3_9STRA|mmetsp:Transcript_18374/g.34903  ORF Transcript_18374/g.34903 Transcript_18374/m.34903 type:complete len:595 (+) Transcript_18374:271-2055(+)